MGRIVNRARVLLFVVAACVAPVAVVVSGQFLQSDAVIIAGNDNGGHGGG